MEKQIRNGLKKLVDAYRKQTGASLSWVSKKIYGNSAFLPDFFAGRRSIQINNLDQVLTKFSTIWPAGLPWPDIEPIPFVPPGKSIPKK